MERIVYTPFLNRQSGFKINTDINVDGYKRRYNISEQEEKESNVEEPKEDIVEIKPIEDTKGKTKFSTKREFIDTMTPIYERLLASKGLNPLFAKSLVAQDGLESA